MNNIKSIFILLLLLFSTIDANSRRRRQYNGYNLIQQYGNQYGLYGPGGQGWVNNYNNRYPNPNYAWNTNANWNQGNRRPEWYYNSAESIHSSMIYVIFLGLFVRLV